MKKTLTIFALLTIMYSCKKPYSPETSETVNSILIVEGTIAAGANVENLFLLSRLRILADTSKNDPEPGATVRIESQSGQNWTLKENANGNYSANLSLSASDKYRLKISTKGGKQFETGFLDVKSTPPIDSVSWAQGEEVDIYVHSHDPSNNTKYYRWEFRETWEYHAFFDTNLSFQNGQIVFLTPAEQMYTCWSTAASGSILLGNTTVLSEDRVSYQPVQKLFPPSQKLSYKYSILVRQFGLSEEAFNFWSTLRKNTELTGSLFDPQPSQLPGNINSMNDPSEKAIGFISAAVVSEKRVFIRNAELSNWQTVPDSTCIETVPESIPVALGFLALDTTYAPAYYKMPPTRVALAKKNCVDCRRKGGSTTKPPYWQ